MATQVRETTNEKVISTKMFHKAKGDEVRSRVVAREYADGVFAPEHHAGTPPTWVLKLVISRIMSKGRTTSACVARCVSCIIPCLGRVGKTSEGSQIERWLALVCGESSPRNERIKQSILRSGTRDVHHVRVDPVADCTMPCLLR